MNYEKLLLPELSIDDVINEIGMGKYHYKMYTLIMFNFVQQNCQNMFPGIILPSISREFDLSKVEKSVYGSIEFLGYFLASVLISKISKIFGEKNAVVLFHITWFLSMALSMMATNIYSFSFFRCLTSISHMVVTLTYFALLSEISPQNFRGIAINMVGIAATLSFILTSGFALFLFDDLETADWRKFFLYFTISIFFSIFINYFYLEDSPRFDLFMGNKTRAFAILSSIKNTFGLINSLKIN